MHPNLIVTVSTEDIRYANIIQISEVFFGCRVRKSETARQHLFISHLFLKKSSFFSVAYDLNNLSEKMSLTKCPWIFRKSWHGLHKFVRNAMTHVIRARSDSVRRSLSWCHRSASLCNHTGHWGPKRMIRFGSEVVDKTDNNHTAAIFFWRRAQGSLNARITSCCCCVAGCSAYRINEGNLINCYKGFSCTGFR